MKKKYFCIAIVAIIAASTIFFPFTGSNKITKNAAVEAVAKKTAIQAQKNEPTTTETTATDRYTVADKKPIRTSKNGLKRAIRWSCPVCGAPAEPDILCAHCREPYTRLYGYGFVRCWKTADGIEWELETSPACGCTPDEACDFCRDKLNHGWKSSNEAEYFEYSDFLKEKGLPMYEAVHPDKPVKKCKKQAVKKMEETIITREMQEVKDVQDENGQGVQQPAGSETETGGDAGQLEDVDNCSGDDNGCRTVDNVDDIAENL